jgi:hypothetical protein
MSWRDLLQKDETRVLPWIGGRSLQFGPRSWKIEGKLPREHGWYVWNLLGARKASLKSEGEPWFNLLGTGVATIHAGYLVGDLLVRDIEPARVPDSPESLAMRFPRVHLLPEGLDHFARVRAASCSVRGPLFFLEEDFPLGPEDEVRDRYLDRKTIEDVAQVHPALDLSFRMLVWRRAKEEERREKIRIEREKEERRRKLRETLGDGEMRRELAKIDFEAAAKAALAVGGAEYIEHRRAPRKNEFVVRYRLDGSRYECVCDETMHVIDAGICLQDHDTGEKGDTYFTLESLPGVTRAAMAAGAAIWRHV